MELRPDPVSPDIRFAPATEEAAAQPAAPPRATALVGLTMAFAVLLLVALVLEASVPPWLGHRLYPMSYEREIARVADRYQVDPYLVAAVVKAESSFEPNAVSPAGAVGLMQVMPATAAWITDRPDWHGPPQPDLSEPDDNLELGTYYLAYLITRFGGDVSTALAAYNAGQGEVARWLASGQPRPASGLRPQDIPFPETRNFVARVERYYALYRDAHPDAFAVARWPSSG